MAKKEYILFSEWLQDHICNMEGSIDNDSVDEEVDRRIATNFCELLGVLEEIVSIFRNSDTTNECAEEMADIATRAIAKVEASYA